MAAESDSTKLCEKISNLSVDSEKRDDTIIPNDSLEYGLPLKEVYKLAFNFYKEKEGKAVHFSYEDKLQLVAFSQQVLHGPLSEALAKLPPLGTLDVVGKDRRDAWQKLGQLSTEQARAGFVELLSRRCPLFSAYVEAHRREKKEQERKAKEEEKRRLIEKEAQQKKEEEQKQVQEQMMKEESIRRQIQQALNEQTYDQFRVYAEQQFPGNRPYKCEVCPVSFISTCDLRVHNRSHTGEKPFLCSTCGKSFRRSTHLNIHKRIHTGEKPYECKTCGRCFAQSGDLKAHQRTHTGERPYVCKLCDKRFNQCSGLASHMKNHLGSKFKCNVCEKKFTRSAGLAKHSLLHQTLS